jgi:DNA-binding NarL/FixJ family response regulator
MWSAPPRTVNRRWTWWPSSSPTRSSSTCTCPSSTASPQREVEILGLIARGLTNPEIAGRLCLSNHTIKTHINRIFAKTGSRDRAAAIGYAHRHHIG